MPARGTFHIREAIATDARPIAEVQVQAWRSTYKGLLDQQLLDSLSADEREQHRKATLALDYLHNLIAETPEGRAIGFCICGPERKSDPVYRSEISAIYVLKEFQGVGVGAALFREGVRRLVEDGHDSMKIWVLKGNPYQRFYRKMGGQVIDEQDIELGGKIYREVAYGWKPLPLDA